MSLLLNQLFPEQLDNDYRGRKLAIWLFGFVVLVKTLQMLVSIVNGYSTLRNADLQLDDGPEHRASLCALDRHHAHGDSLCWS